MCYSKLKEQHRPVLLPFYHYCSFWSERNYKTKPKQLLCFLAVSLLQWRRSQPHPSSTPWSATSRSHGSSLAHNPTQNSDTLFSPPPSTVWRALPPPRSSHGSPLQTRRPSSTSSTTLATSVATALRFAGLCSRKLMWRSWWRRPPSMSKTFPDPISLLRCRRTWILTVEGTRNRSELFVCDLLFCMFCGFRWSWLFVIWGFEKWVFHDFVFWRFWMCNWGFGMMSFYFLGALFCLVHSA